MASAHKVSAHVLTVIFMLVYNVNTRVLATLSLMFRVVVTVSVSLMRVAHIAAVKKVGRR
jgi:hypothetical protein